MSSAATLPNNNEDSLSEILYPLALLMDELKHDDVANRVNAMQKLDTIAIALGPQRSREELIPFLFDVAHDDEDEVFAVLADQLNSSFIPLIGGEQYATQLLPTLEFLAAIEEPVVRDKAIASLNDIAAHLSADNLNKDFIEGITSLATADWYSSRVSSCGLFKSVISRVDSKTTRNMLLQLYYKLIIDETPMTRRAAASSLPEIIDSLATCVDKLDDDDWLFIFQMFGCLVADDQDSVKFLSVEVLLSILKIFNDIKHDDSHNKKLLHYFLELCNNESWRVRYMISERFAPIVSYFTKEDLNGPILDNFVSLLKDHEAEVRKSISKQIPEVSKLLDNSTNIINKIIPQVEELVNDPNELVRAALASQIANLAPILGEQHTTDVLLNIFLEMLNDEFPEVRLNIISNLTILNDVIGIQLLTKALLPAITELAKDKQWRVRLAIIEYIPLLSKQLGMDFFNNVLNKLCMLWLWDSVYTIREAAVLNLMKLAKIFGDDWTKLEIIDKIILGDLLEDYKKENEELFNNTANNNNSANNGSSLSLVNGDTHIENVNSSIMNNFIYRITCLFTMLKVSEVIISDSIIIDDILPWLETMSHDPVPNVRFNVAKGYKTIAFKLLEIEDKHNKENKDQKDDIKDPILTSSKGIGANDEDNYTGEISKDLKVSEDELLSIQKLNKGTLVSNLSKADVNKMRDIVEQKIVSNLKNISENDADMDVKWFSDRAIAEINIALDAIGK